MAQVQQSEIREYRPIQSRHIPANGAPPECTYNKSGCLPKIKAQGHPEPQHRQQQLEQQSGPTNNNQSNNQDSHKNNKDSHKRLNQLMAVLEIIFLKSNIFDAFKSLQPSKNKNAAYILLFDGFRTKSVKSTGNCPLPPTNVVAWPSSMC